MNLDEQTTDRVLAAVLAERRKQHIKWGEQNWPDGTGDFDGEGPARHLVAEFARRECDTVFRAGRGTYLAILAEEVAEAFAESDPARLRAELVQVAAVAVAWVEKIDREQTGRGATGEG